ncbi:hypothetical protein POM88_001361 [Heracleum sosnowskyi]|uniref:Uncharacterized protein n=1 Tax=Heracleum sosnowskyi TaxID=360622 RepID=A0AAD8JFP2_9APIA|nr:hypothetical protein POM88_001361 [Heracleum sosnowskyi]
MLKKILSPKKLSRKILSWQMLSAKTLSWRTRWRKILSDTVMEDVVKDETKKVVKPKRTKSLARAWFSRQKFEAEKTAKTKKGKTEYSGKEKATGLGRNLRKPIQTKLYNSFDMLKKDALEIKNVKVKLDDNNEANQYVLWYDSSKSVKVKKDFTMELVSQLVTENFSLRKGIVTRRIDYFILERMVNLMQGYDNVPDKVMEHVLIYKAERDEEFYQKHGNLALHDDADIANLLEYSDEEIIEYEDDFPEEEVQVMPSQERSTKAEHDQSVEEMEAELLNRCKDLNKGKSKEPNFQPCVLENALRAKYGNEEIYLDNFHKLKTHVLKELNYSVVGSTNHLELLCSFELEEIIHIRKESKSLVKTQEQWMDLQDAQQVSSKIAQQYIDEIEDDAISPMEISLVESLKSYVAEASRREEEARQKRRSQG